MQIVGRMQQLALDFGTDPLTCEHGEHHQEINRTYCKLHDAWTNCREPVCGDPPMCAWEEPDNSPEAVARRLEWMRRNNV